MDRYCLCRGPDDGSFMIECDFCKDWFHGRCIGMSAKQGKQLHHQQWLCCKCTISNQQGVQQTLNASVIEVQNLSKINSNLQKELLESLQREKERTSDLQSVNEEIVKALNARQSKEEELIKSLRDSIKELNEANQQVILESELILKNLGESVAAPKATNQKSVEERIRLVPQQMCAPTNARKKFESRTEPKVSRMSKSQPCQDEEDDDNIFRTIKPELPKRKRLSSSLPK